jgi:hypothetical protein
MFGKFASNITPGNSVVLIAGLYTASASGTMNTSNPQFGGGPVTGTKLVEGTSPYDGSGRGYTVIWLLPSLPGGASSVSVDPSGADGPLGIFAYEVAGLGDNPQLDPAGGLAAVTGTDTVVDSGSTPAITQNSEIIFGFGHDYAVVLSSPSAAWTTQPPGGYQNFWGGYQLTIFNVGS